MSYVSTRDALAKALHDTDPRHEGHESCDRWTGHKDWWLAWADDLVAGDAVVDAAFVAVVLNGSTTAAVAFPTMGVLYEWEDAHPEVEVVSTMPLVSRNHAEQAAR